MQRRKELSYPDDGTVQIEWTTDISSPVTPVHGWENMASSLLILQAVDTNRCPLVDSYT